MRDEPIARIKRSICDLTRPHKRCEWILTVGRWPWKQESAKECVTAHQPNPLALKMDSAKIASLYRAEAMKLYHSSSRMACWEGRRLRVNVVGPPNSADLGSSSY